MPFTFCLSAVWLIRLDHLRAWMPSQIYCHSMIQFPSSSSWSFWCFSLSSIRVMVTCCSHCWSQYFLSTDICLLLTEFLRYSSWRGHSTQLILMSSLLFICLAFVVERQSHIQFVSTVWHLVLIGFGDNRTEEAAVELISCVGRFLSTTYFVYIIQSVCIS